MPATIWSKLGRRLRTVSSCQPNEKSVANHEHGATQMFQWEDKGMKIQFIAAAVMLLSSTCAHAGSATNVTITNIESNAQGQFSIWVSATISNSPNCAVQPAKQFIVDGTTTAGAVVVTVAEAAYSLGKTLTISGDNSCSVHSGYETVSDIVTL